MKDFLKFEHDLLKQIAYYIDLDSKRPIRKVKTFSDLVRLCKIQKGLIEVTNNGVNHIRDIEALRLAMGKLSKNGPALINGAGMNGNQAILPIGALGSVHISIGCEQRALLPDNYTEFHHSVAMAVGSLVDYLSSMFITCEDIARHMLGMKPNEKVHPEFVASVQSAVFELRNMFMEIDRQEIAGKYKRGNDWFVIKRSMMPFVDYGEILNQKGNAVLALHFEHLPPIYQHEKDLKQIRRIPYQVIKVKGLRSSEENVALKFALLREIESMRKVTPESKARNNTIKIDTLLEKLKYDIPAKRRKRYAGYMIQMLDYWQSIGYITGYTENNEYTAKKTILHSVTVDLNMEGIK